MRLVEDHDDTESWTGEQDNVAAIALGVCLFVAALVFLTLAVGELHA